MQNKFSLRLKLFVTVIPLRGLHIRRTADWVHVLHLKDLHLNNSLIKLTNEARQRPSDHFMSF